MSAVRAARRNPNWNVALALGAAVILAARPADAQTGPLEVYGGGHADVPSDGIWPDAFIHSELDAGPAIQAGDGWRFQLTPYLWASGLKGRVGVEERPVDVDVGFSEILDHLDGAIMLAGAASRGRWGGAFEVIYIRLSAQRATPGPLFDDAELDVKEVIVELTGRYQFISLDQAVLEFLAGGRYWKLDNTLLLTEGVLPEREFSEGASWWDPVVGARALADLSSRWLVMIRGDVGGFGKGSRFSGQLLGVLGYRPSQSWSIQAGYRYLAVDYEEDLIFDVGMSGFIMGATFEF